MPDFRWIAAIALAIVFLVNGFWYTKSKNKGHLTMAVCSLIASILFLITIFAYPRATP